MTSGSCLAKRKRAEVSTRSRGTPDMVRTMRFEDRHTAIVHGQNHGRRSTFLRYPLHDFCGPGQAHAESAHFRGTKRASQTCRTERFDRFGGE